MGIISAVSLPLGTLTLMHWRPSDRAQAVLMAVGGGALLAALTIDLVASAVAQGHFYFMAVGAVLGGLLFLGLNHLVNRSGGFLRKTSTTLVYLRGQRQRRLRHILSRMGRIAIFRELPERDLLRLADVIEAREFRAGELLYQQGDPCDAMFIIEEGRIELLDPQKGMQPFQRLGRSDAFARMAFFTGSPHATVAVAVTDGRLWVFPRPAFMRHLPSSPELIQAVAELLQGEEVQTYLRQRQGFAETRVQQWLQQAVTSLQRHGWFESAVYAGRQEAKFKDAVRNARRASFLRDLPPEEIDAIAQRVIYKRHRQGDVFFHQNEAAERLYVIDQGRVALIDPADRGRKQDTLDDNEAFGTFSFLTGTPHSKTAVAVSDVSVWVLRKRDFETLLQGSQRLEQAVRSFIQEAPVTDYLRAHHDFDHQSAARWVRLALRNMDAGRLIPSAADVLDQLSGRSSAPIAIWLGMLLDGIPESLVIGASLAHMQMSLSLIAGLFLSNYPEALSSSAGMRQQGFSYGTVLLMWTSTMLLTGVGAALGNLLFLGLPPFVFSFTEGVAAGAMLVMIAETMLPEAYVKGGPVVGMSTLLGFLAAIFFKTLE